MSFEGSYQKLCKVGHLIEIDVYWDNDDDKCSCGEPFVWVNLVDETNGSYCDCPAGNWAQGLVEDAPPHPECEYCNLGRIDNYVELEVDKPATTQMCNLGHKHIIGQVTYKIPSGEKNEDDGALP